MSIPGIGPMISTAMVAAIGKGEVFDRGHDFAAWVGLVPQQFSTGGRMILGRITKRGSRYLRILLVQAARIIMMRPHLWPNDSFDSWLAGVVTRVPGNKAAIALADKLARIAWSILRALGSDSTATETETWRRTQSDAAAPFGVREREMATAHEPIKQAGYI